MRYLLGLSEEKPKIGRFGYAEKMEYWAVVWGTVIMGVTGLIVWFKMDVTQWLPRWAVDMALTIHYYEAMLACLAILVQRRSKNAKELPTEVKQLVQGGCSVLSTK